jgi:hypothetical protein
VRGGKDGSKKPKKKLVGNSKQEMMREMREEAAAEADQRAEKLAEEKKAGAKLAEAEARLVEAEAKLAEAEKLAEEKMAEEKRVNEKKRADARQRSEEKKLADWYIREEKRQAAATARHLEYNTRYTAIITQFYQNNDPVKLAGDPRLVQRTLKEHEGHYEEIVTLLRLEYSEKETRAKSKMEAKKREAKLQAEKVAELEAGLEAPKEGALEARRQAKLEELMEAAAERLAMKDLERQAKAEKKTAERQAKLKAEQAKQEADLQVKKEEANLEEKKEALRQVQNEIALEAAKAAQRETDLHATRVAEETARQKKSNWENKQQTMRCGNAKCKKAYYSKSVTSTLCPGCRQNQADVRVGKEAEKHSFVGAGNTNTGEKNFCGNAKCRRSYYSKSGTSTLCPGCRQNQAGSRVENEVETVEQPVSAEYALYTFEDPTKMLPDSVWICNTAEGTQIGVKGKVAGGSKRKLCCTWEWCDVDKLSAFHDATDMDHMDLLAIEGSAGIFHFECEDALKVRNALLWGASVEHGVVYDHNTYDTDEPVSQPDCPSATRPTTRSMGWAETCASPMCMVCGSKHFSVTGNSNVCCHCISQALEHEEEQDALWGLATEAQTRSTAVEHPEQMSRSADALPATIHEWLESVNPALQKYGPAIQESGYDNLPLLLHADEKDLNEMLDKIADMKPPHRNLVCKAVLLIKSGCSGCTTYKGAELLANLVDGRMYCVGCARQRPVYTFSI